MTENIVGVVNPIWQGVPSGRSLYLRMPHKLRDRRQFTEKTSFVVIEAQNGDIIYRPQGA